MPRKVTKLGVKIKYYLVDRGNRQQDLANYLSIVASALTRKLSGDNPWHPHELDLVSEFFGLDDEDKQELSNLARECDALSGDDEIMDSQGKAPTSRMALGIPPPAIHSFQTLVEKYTRNFVGREFIFQAIDEMLNDPTFQSGYILIRGEPGIGKTALISQLVKQKGYVHHFNIALQNIRSIQDFLANICAQIIVRYKLNHSIIPPEANKDSGFLSRLLAEAAAKQQERPVVILVDALDEAEDLGLPPNTNRLFLPPTLPNGVYFIITSREKKDYRLFVDRQQDIYLDEKDPQNLEDVRHYIQNFVDEHRVQMAPQIAQWKVDEDEFVSLISQKSEGNFMYLVYVLGDICDGRLTATNVNNIHNLPTGLRAYYQQHWRRMQVADQDRFERYYEPVVCILATVREPVTLAQVTEWTKLSMLRVKEVITDWREFLNEDPTEQGEPLYRIYHTSFQDFLEDEVGLMQYHSTIAQTALDRIQW